MLSDTYKPTHDEASRQAFVGCMKGILNGPVEGRLDHLYQSVIADKMPGAEDTGSKREAAKALFEDQYLYQVWGSLVYTSQDLLWETVGATVDRQRPDFEALANQASQSGSAGGSLTLNPKLELPEPISNLEIHRQPGGYFFQSNDQDLTSPLMYFASIELYRKAKGLSSGADTGEPGMGRFILHNFKQKFPDAKPKRILDLGCAIGTETLAIREAFPDAEIHGLDLSGPFVRFAHAWAEGKGVEAHFKQACATDTGYVDGYFDLIISHILFHETWHDIMPKIMKEAHRILAPGGVFYNADVPYQPHRMSVTKQVTNDWQVRYNGEPFWTGFVDTDVTEPLEQAGFEKDHIFGDYIPLGQGHYYFFGGEKTKDGGAANGQD